VQRGMPETADGLSSRSSRDVASFSPAMVRLSACPSGLTILAVGPSPVRSASRLLLLPSVSLMWQ